MVKLSKADTAISYFTKAVARYDSTQCNMQSVNTATCNLGTVEITGCKNLKLACCNDVDVALLSCASSFLFTEAMNSVIKVTGGSSGSSKNSGLSSLRQRLANYLASSAVTPQQAADTNSSTRSMLSTYFSTVCSAQEVTEQTVAVPALKGTHCSSDVVAMFNRSDVVLRCTMGAISNLLPTDDANANELLKVAPLPWYHITAKTKKYVLVITGVLVAFCIMLFFANISDIDRKD
jgi:hypothetical protein